MKKKETMELSLSELVTAEAIIHSTLVDFKNRLGELEAEEDSENKATITAFEITIAKVESIDRKLNKQINKIIMKGK